MPSDSTLSKTKTEVYSSIRRPLTDTKWYTTMNAMAATPRPFDRFISVVSEIIVSRGVVGAEIELWGWA
jgi:hypothetical protein